ncbi:hypothetical protein FisN_20Hu189 [Fistulifera solaris]|jgi:hypothetical protein|uniref:Uncharacterized protein n=1 Tax=Fistulifera solaris TaxID=1519565 RepID=A0A1Z5JK66_FISSO|nr:hypothetical protein FisN_20Hu189 [Fistulifera solaris]|eukprot:GAX14188.1 hypothetical protein FisN_20Hu189 [Fistulifera solaris]
MNRANEKVDLLKLIPENKTWGRVLVRDFRRAVYPLKLPLYKLRREPSRLDEIDWKKYGEFGIWRDNRTVIRFADCDDNFEACWGRYFFFTIEGKDYWRMCMIYGETDAAIAETATFFWSLKVEDDPNALL